MGELAIKLALGVVWGKEAERRQTRRRLDETHRVKSICTKTQNMGVYVCVCAFVLLRTHKMVFLAFPFETNQKGDPLEKDTWAPTHPEHVTKVTTPLATCCVVYLPVALSGLRNNRRPSLKVGQWASKSPIHSHPSSRCDRSGKKIPIPLCFPFG